MQMRRSTRRLTMPATTLSSPVYAKHLKPPLGNNYRPFVPLIDQTSINRTDVPAVKALYDDVAQALARYNPDGDYILALHLG
jgi:alpha-galactosidase